ncbi:o-succinylbenzoate synthase [Hugenholtzia roseola]|uniref:o-succinylbenzoate synthase n=1 Tax=Hugenholtzia roseola TaxID=1002 RepID=UPI0003FB1070|nr:o-succinylbenzoate synthase [Hugenholtzia roseola]
MPYQISIKKHPLAFRFEAATSKGVLQTHQSYQIYLCHRDLPEIKGCGEAAPLSHLSPDYQVEIEKWVAEVESLFAQGLLPESQGFWKQAPLQHPAFRFGLETAWLNLEARLSDYLLKNQDPHNQWKIFDQDFYRGRKKIHINGLIWIGKPEVMRAQIRAKIEAGFSCLKLKIGALDFETECKILSEIREKKEADPRLILRLDANGAFSKQEALRKLEQLAKYQIHSIEQPIAPSNPEEWDFLSDLCKNSPIPIALDEELIGKDSESLPALLEAVRPAYCIIKPTLLGGLQKSKFLIELAQEKGIGWWLTSALESNIGLNAIAQFAAQYDLALPQGLGTGGLYHNNIPSPLTLESEELYFKR